MAPHRLEGGAGVRPYYERRPSYRFLEHVPLYIAVDLAVIELYRTQGNVLITVYANIRRVKIVF
jgi:hypothetical protein